MKTSDVLTALAAGVAVFLIARAVWGPDKYGLDKSSDQSKMLAEQDKGFY